MERTHQVDPLSNRVPYVVAELNTSHRGDIEAAKQAIELASRLGADAVKFQSWRPESLYTRQYLEANSLEGRLFEKFSLTAEELRELVLHASAQGIQASSTAYSLDEVDALASLEAVPFIKIASMDFVNRPLVEYALSSGKPVVLSTGMTSPDEIREAADWILAAGVDDLTLLHCVSVYPTPFEESAVGTIAWLKNQFPGIRIGFSDHSLTSHAACMAAMLGVRFFEKHLTDDRSRPGFDNHMAMEASEFEQFVLDVHAASHVAQVRERVIPDSEREQAARMRRSAHAARPILAGQVIGVEDVIYRRPGTGIGYGQVESELRLVALEGIAAGSLLDWANVSIAYLEEK